MGFWEGFIAGAVFCLLLFLAWVGYEIKMEEDED